MYLKISGGQEIVTKKIEEYKKKYPELKHTRKKERDGKTLGEFPMTCKGVWDMCTDTLESDRVMIEIKSIVFVGLKHFVIMSDELSDLQKKRLKETLEAQTKAELEKGAFVTITDKAMKKFLESQKK